MIRILFLSFILLALPNQGSAQCASPQLVTSLNIHNVTDPFQLTFLHRVPKNSVDSIVPELVNTSYKHIVNYHSMLEIIAKQQSEEAFLLLYVACLHDGVVEDLNAFYALSSKVINNGGLELLNTYYLKGAAKPNMKLDSALRAVDYKKQILDLCAKRKAKPYFCLALNQAYTVERMLAQIDSAFSEYEPCATPTKVDSETIYLIHNPYEFTFLHKVPQNATDSTLAWLMTGPYDFNSPKRLEGLAKSKTQEAFLFFYACAAVDEKKDISTNHFHSIANQVNIWGGVQFLNKYFLDSAVAGTLYQVGFRDEVVRKSRGLNPEIYYCHQPTIAELYANEMQSIDPKQYDKAIIKIIKKYSDTNKPNCSKNIVREVQQLPFVVDLLWDGCYAKNDIYPVYYSLVVIMNIGDKQVERYYNMNGAEFKFYGIRFGKKCQIGRVVETSTHKLVVTAVGYSPGYLEKARNYCELLEKKRRNEIEY